MIKNRFFTMHAAPVLLYFAAVLIVTMGWNSPVLCAVSLTCAVLCRCYIGGRRVLRACIPLSLSVILVLTVVNPLLNTGGLTVIFTLLGHAFTLEAILYGFSSGCMLAAVIQWFALFHDTASSEKLLDILSGVMPTVALTAVMTARYIPRLIKTASEAESVRRALCAESGGRVQTIKNALRTSTVVLEKSLADSIETARSMNARGFKNGARKTHRARMRYSDKAAFTVLFFMAAAAAGLLFACGQFRFYPSLHMPSLTYVAACLLAVLCLVPLLCDGKDAIVCRLSK